MGIAHHFRSFTSFIVLLAWHILPGQQVFIKVTDLKTGEPMPFAHVCLESPGEGKQSHSLTDIKGEVINTATETSIVSVSFVGYETTTDTVYPGQPKHIRLNPEVFNMNEVVVTAQYSPQRVDKSIYKVRVIGAKQIAEKGANNLSELLNDELSVRLTQDGALGTSMSIRGLSGEHVKILVDGVPVIGRMNGNIDLGQMNLHNVDHIEVVEGPMSVIYGSNALAGVVNIITKENKYSSFSSVVDSYYESAGIYNFNGMVSAGKNRNSFSLSAARNFFTGKNATDSERSMIWKPKRQTIIDGYYFYQQDNLKLKYSGNYFDEVIWNKGDVIEPHFALDNYFYTRRFNNKVEAGIKSRGKRFLNTWVAFSQYSRTKNTYFKDLSTLEKNLTSNSGDNDTTRFRSFTGRAVYSKSNENDFYNYQAGLDVNTESGTGKRIMDNEQNIGDYAAFLSMKFNPVPIVTLQPGIRLIYNTRYKAPLIYSLNVKWDPSSKTYIRASYSRGFRAPALKELYLYFVDINHNIRGNEDLEAEDSHNIDLSTGYKTEKGKKSLNADVSLFYNRINNIITLAQLTSDLYTYINLDIYESRGYQLMLTGNFHPWISLQAGISQTGRKNVSDNEVYSAKSFLNSTDLSGKMSYRIQKYNAEVSAFYKYTGKLPQYFIDSNGQPVEGFISAFHTMDITAVKYFYQRKLQFTAGVKNLFDNQVIPSMGTGSGAHSGGGSGTLVGWGRTFFAKITWTFQKFRE